MSAAIAGAPADNITIAVVASKSFFIAAPCPRKSPGSRSPLPNRFPRQRPETTYAALGDVSRTRMASYAESMEMAVTRRPQWMANPAMRPFGASWQERTCKRPRRDAGAFQIRELRPRRSVARHHRVFAEPPVEADAGDPHRVALGEVCKGRRRREQEALFAIGE